MPSFYEDPVDGTERPAVPGPTSRERLLVDYIQKLEHRRKDRLAVVVRLSGLQPANRREHHIRAALDSFATLVKQMKGQVFSLSNADIVFIFYEAVIDEVEAALIKLRFLFNDDPLLLADQDFVDWYVLEHDYDALLQYAQNVLIEKGNRKSREPDKSDIPRQAARLFRRSDPLTPEMLAKIEEALVGADLANMMRRQAICAIVGKAPPQPVFNELFISIADLREVILPHVDLASSPWLFQQLTEVLDKRVLSFLGKRDDRTVAGDISMNLNVQTLLSPEFLNFDDNLSVGMRGSIVLELQKVDIFADPGGFLFARDFAHDRGYRICVDGVNLESLPFIDRERLGADLVKLVWDPAMIEGRLPNGDSLGRYIRRCGPSRAILCRCDAQKAIDWGGTVGIALYQGRHVEAMLTAEADKTRGR